MVVNCFLDYLIIGNGPAGIAAVRELSNRDLNGAKIIQFSDEEFPHYSRPKIPHFLGDSTISKEKVYIHNLEWYKSNNIELHLNEKVSQIDPTNKTINTTKSEYPYLKLLIATGASCFYPPMERTELKNFFTLRTLSDAFQIRKQLSKTDNIVIIGGGLLGLEIANSVLNQGKSVTIVEYFPYLLPRQLDQEGATILQKILENRGIKFHLGSTVKVLTGDNYVQGVTLVNGKEIPAGLVLTCVGIRCNTDLAKKIKLQTNKGIIVNDYLETSKPDIFAAGDVAEHKGIIYGLWTPAQEQGKIAANNMVSQRSKIYNGSKISTTLKITDIYLTSFGELVTEHQGFVEKKKYINENKDEYVKLFLKDEIIIGGIFLGTKRGISLIRKAMYEKINTKDILNKIGEVFPEMV